jgi:hypothetical protein
MTINAATPFSTGFQRDGGMANPDEAAHLLYVKQLQQHGHPAVFHKDSPDYEALQPPLYYAICLPFASGNKVGDEAVAKNVRIVSLFFGAVIIVLTFFAFVALFPEDRIGGLLASAFVAFLPMALSLCASVGNDTLTNLVIVASFLSTFCILRHVDTWSPTQIVGSLCALGVLLGAGMWVKTSTLLFWPALIAMVAVVGTKKHVICRPLAMGCALSLLIAAVISAPWLVRNVALYGDPLAEQAFVEGLKDRNFSIDTMIHLLGPWGFLLTEFSWTFDSFWGVFDSMTLFLPKWAYLTAFAASTLALIGLVKTLRASKLDIVQQSAFCGFGVLTFLTTMSFIQYNTHFFQAQGRYFFPALLPFAVCWSVGLRRVMPQKYADVIAGAVSVGLFALMDALAVAAIGGRFHGA